MKLDRHEERPATAQELRDALRLIDYSNFEPIEGTRSGTIMLTIEEMRRIRQLVGANPISSPDHAKS